MFKNILRFTITLLLATWMLNTYALDQMAKEETTPPPAEGALTPEQIPAVYSKNENLPPSTK
jgi:hypothetical protein